MDRPVRNGPRPPQRGGDFESCVLRVIRGLQPGDVATYGEVAEEAGYPGAARAVGNVLARARGLPWWRVVTASGRLVPGHESEQARRLRLEGCTVANGRLRRSENHTIVASRRLQRRGPGRGRSSATTG
jgi:methylated-DNA-protein-cysteine methyltransferase-like protein